MVGSTRSWRRWRRRSEGRRLASAPDLRRHRAGRATLVGLADLDGAAQARYVPLGHQGFGRRLARSDAGARDAAPMLAIPVRKSRTRLKADLIVLGRHGVVAHRTDLDTMLAAYLLDANPFDQALSHWRSSRWATRRSMRNSHRQGRQGAGSRTADRKHAGLLGRAQRSRPAAGRPASSRARREGSVGLPRARIAADAHSRRGSTQRGVRVDVQALAAQAGSIAS